MTKPSSNVPNTPQAVLGDPVMSVAQAMKHLTTAKNPPKKVPDNLNVVLKTSPGRGALFIGNIMSVAVAEILEDHRIKAVLSCGHNVVFNKEQCAYKGVEATKAILARDVVTYDMSQHFEECIKFIEENLALGRNVLVHCHAGVSRSATIVIAYLMAKYNMFANEATDFLKSKRECIQPNDRFLQNLKDFQKEVAKGKYLWVSQPTQQAVHESNIKKSKLKEENFNKTPSQIKKVSSVAPAANAVGSHHKGQSIQKVAEKPTVHTLHPSHSTSVLQPKPIVPNIQNIPKVSDAQNSQNKNSSWNLNHFKLPPKPKTQIKSEGTNIRTTLFTDVGGFCSFTDTDFEDRTEFSNISKGLSEHGMPNALGKATNRPVSIFCRPGVI